MPTVPMAAAEVDAPQRRRTSLTVASGLLGVSTIASRLTTLVAMALLARGAGTEAVGYYGLATLIASFTAAVLSVGLPTYLTRDFAAGLVSAPQVARIHCGRLVTLLLAAAVAYPVAGGLLPGLIQLGFFLFFAASLLEQWNETAWVLVRGTRSAWLEPLTNSATGVLLIVACSAETWLGDGLAFNEAAGYFVAAAVLRSAMAFIVVGMWRKVRSPGRVDPMTQLRRSLPYFASDLLGLLYFRGDVFILAMFVAASEVGEYVSAAAIIGPAVQVAASMGLGAVAYAAPRLLSDRSPSDDPVAIFRFFRISGQTAAGLICLALPIGVVVLFGGDGDDILALATILTLFLALRFANFGLSAMLLAHGRATSRLLVLVVSLGGNVVLNLALDGRYGAHGAAWATVLTELIVAGSLLWFLRIRALVRPVLVSAAGVAVAAAALIGTRAAVEPALATMVPGGFLLALAALGLLRQRRAARRTVDPAGVENDEQHTADPQRRATAR
ncbi:oligosaccharide flippase family protein [Micromonospora sp. NPDC004704]